MWAVQAERLLILRRGRIFDPEGTIRLEILAEPRRLDRGKPVVVVVEQMDVPAERFARRGEQLGHDAHIFRGRPRSEEHTSELQSLIRSSYAVHCLNKYTTPLDNHPSTTSITRSQ